MASHSLCSWGQTWMACLSAFTSQRLGLKVYASTPGSKSYSFKCCFMKVDFCNTSNMYLKAFLRRVFKTDSQCSWEVYYHIDEYLERKVSIYNRLRKHHLCLKLAFLHYIHITLYSTSFWVGLWVCMSRHLHF